MCAPDIPPTPQLPDPPPPEDMGPALSLQAESMRLQTQVMEKQVELAERQAKIGDSTFAFWQKRLAPLQAGVMRDASRGLRTEPFEGRAKAAVIQSSFPTRRATEQGLSLRGVDPSAPMAVAAKQDISTRTAQAAGGAQYSARRNIEELNRGRKQQAYATGATYPAQAVAGYGSAAGMMGRAAVPVANAYTSLANTHVMQAQQESQIANQAWSLQVQGIMADYNREVQMSMAGAAGMNQMFGTVATIGAMKIMLPCLPGAALIDVPCGYATVETVKAGDTVMGLDGKPCTAIQVHSYIECPDGEKLVPFLDIVVDTGEHIQMCALHIVDKRPAGKYAVGDPIGHLRVAAVNIMPDIRRSFDILTDGPDGGYMMHGVPVESMIELNWRRTGRLR